VEFKHDFKEYVKFDIGAMGEFDVAVLIEQYVGKKISERCIRSGAVATTTPPTKGGRGSAHRPVLCIALVECGESIGVCRDLCPVVG